MPTSKSMDGLAEAASSPLSPPRRSSTASLSNMAGTTKSSVPKSVYTQPTPRRNNQRPPRHGHGRVRIRQRRETNNFENLPPKVPMRKTKNIHREYRLLQSQTFLLVGTATMSFLLFLLFTLPFVALVGLTVMVTSLGACVLVASAAAKTKYELEMQHPLGLVRHLPESLRAHLTEKSLHDCLSRSESKESLASLTKCPSAKGSLSSMSQYNSKGSLSSLS